MASALLLFLKEKQQKNFVRNCVSPLFLQRENFISFQAFPLGVGFESQTFCLPPGGKVAPKGPDEGAV